MPLFIRLASSQQQVSAPIMRSIVSVLIVFLGALIAVPVAYVGAYDLFVFQRHIPEVQRLIEVADQDERTPSPLVARVIRAGVSQHLSAQVSRLLLQRFNPPASQSQLQWHFTSALWWALVALHLSDQDQSTLYLSLSYVGNGVTGYGAASKAQFGVSLNSLSLEQVATLSAISKAPNAYLESPERLARARIAIIKRVQSGL